MGEIQQGDKRQEGERREREGGGADRMEHGGKEKEGEGSAEPQLHPLMLHVSVSRSAALPCRVTKKGLTQRLVCSL